MYTLSHTHTHSYFSVVYQIWAYSSLVLSIDSRVHLGEPKLIEAHHNGLFISYWTDRPTPSPSLLSHLFLQIWREKWNLVGGGQCLAECGGLQGHLCVFTKLIWNQVFSSPLADWSFTPTHINIYVYTYKHKSGYTSKLPLFHSYLHFQSLVALLSPVFVLLLDILKSSKSHTTQSLGLSFCCPPPFSLCILPFSLISHFHNKMRI